MLIWLVLACTARTPPSSPSPSACGVQPDGSRRFRVLHLNDVYRIGGLSDGRGGLARVRTLRADLESDCPGGVLLTHAGDALFPSLLSREFDGAQMIDVLNRLDGDGDGAAMDDHMVFTIGNHEFDKSRAEHAALLEQHIGRSQFPWLATNLTFRTVDGVDLASAPNLHRSVVLDAAGVKVGVFGATIDKQVPAYVERIDPDYVGIAREMTARLRREGAEVVIGLTHLDIADDRRILSELGANGPDLVLGGHDHVLVSEEVAGRPLLKGDADAVRVRTVEVRVEADGAVTTRSDPDGVHLDDATHPPDPGVQARVQHYLDAFDRAFCGPSPGCLAEELTVTRTPLRAEETRIRRYETNLGDWVADRMLATFQDADVAVLNSGSLRLNQDVAAGTPITRQIVEETFAYPAPMHVVAITGSTLREVLERSVADWTGQGHWLQVSGVAFRHDPWRQRVDDVRVRRGDRWMPLDPSAIYRVVTLRYLLDPGIGDQDGYSMLSLDQVTPTAADGQDLEVVVLDALRAAGSAGIAPKRDHRICNIAEAGAPCLSTAEQVRLEAVEPWLARAASASRLPPAERDGLARGLTRLVLATADGVSEADWPDFVADTVEGVFEAVVDASVAQMEAYADLVEQATKTLEEFVEADVASPEARRAAFLARWSAAVAPILDDEDEDD